MRAPVVCCVFLGVLITVPARLAAQNAAAAAASPQASAPEPPGQSLFEPTWRQVQIGGRLSSVAGDPARWQRYQDLRDGPVITDARYEYAWGATGTSLRATADNVGWRDQRYTALLRRPGRFTV